MAKTQKTFFAVLTALIVGALVFAIIATEVITTIGVWVAALITAIVVTLVWVFGLRIRVSDKSKKTIWQSINGVILVITFIILFMFRFGGTGNNVDPVEPTSKVTTTGESTTVAPEMPIDDETTKVEKPVQTTKVNKPVQTTKVEKPVQTTKVEKPVQTTAHSHKYVKVSGSEKVWYEASANGHIKYTKSADKKCTGCGHVVTGATVDKTEAHSYNSAGKCACGATKPTTTSHSHNYTAVSGSEKVWYEASANGHIKYTKSADKKCTGCGHVVTGATVDKTEAHSYNSAGKCICGAEKPTEPTTTQPTQTAKVVLNSRLVSAENGYLCVTPEDAVSITLYGMDKDDLKYSYTNGDGKLVTNEGITFTHKYTDPETGAKLYSMRLSDELRAMSTDIKFYPKGSSTPVILTVEPQYE